MSTPILEICVDSIDALLAASRGGADRVELCSALSEGGLTPSIGFIRIARRLCPSLPMHVMIRPRMGDFLYSQEEKLMMLDDIKSVGNLGIQGIVLGALTPTGEIDIAFLHKVKELVGVNLSITFHRAFDLCTDRQEAMRVLATLGIDRILSSGGKQTALEGARELASLVASCGSCIEIMPGAGIRADNILRLRELTGANEFHLSARQKVDSLMEYRNTSVSMGSRTADEYTRYTANELMIRQIVDLLKGK